MYKSPWFTCKAKWTYSSGIRTTPLRQPDAFLFKAGPRNHLSDMHLIIAIIIMQLPLYKVYDAIWYEGMFVFFFCFFFSAAQWCSRLFVHVSWYHRDCGVTNGSWEVAKERHARLATTTCLKIGKTIVAMYSKHEATIKLAWQWQTEDATVTHRQLEMYSHWLFYCAKTTAQG